ncbi:MAG: hypothetical protein ACOC6A_03140 [Chloroflexota bacterium]
MYGYEGLKGMATLVRPREPCGIVPSPLWRQMLRASIQTVV